MVIYRQFKSWESGRRVAVGWGGVREWIREARCLSRPCPILIASAMLDVDVDADSTRRALGDSTLELTD